MAEAGGRGGGWGTVGASGGRADHMHQWQCCRPHPRPHVPAPYSAQPGLGLLGGSEGPKSSTWRKEETPGVGLRRPLSGEGPLPRLPLPLFCAYSLEAGASQGGVVGEGPGRLPPLPLALAALLKQNITGRCPGLPSSPASLATGLPLVVAGLKPWEAPAPARMTASGAELGMWHFLGRKIGGGVWEAFGVGFPGRTPPSPRCPWGSRPGVCGRVGGPGAVG